MRHANPQRRKVSRHAPPRWMQAPIAHRNAPPDPAPCAFRETYGLWNKVTEFDSLHEQTTNAGMHRTPCAHRLLENNDAKQTSTRRFRCARATTGRRLCDAGRNNAPQKQHGVRAIAHKEIERERDGEAHTCAASSLVGASTRARGLAARV
jgi:hypothetical protein